MISPLYKQELEKFLAILTEERKNDRLSKKVDFVDKFQKKYPQYGGYGRTTLGRYLREIDGTIKVEQLPPSAASASEPELLSSTPEETTIAVKVNGGVTPPVRNNNGLIEPSEHAEFLKTRVRELEGQVKKLRQTVGGNKDLLQEIKDSVVKVEPYPSHIYKPASKKASRVVAVMKWSDWHIGEYIRAEETEGFGNFDYSIAQMRIFGMVQDFIQWAEIQRTVYNINECAIFCEGDFISGDIHYELQVTNEFPLPEQTAKAGLLIGECLRRLAPHFDKVKVYQIAADNHGRLVRKPQFKQKSSNNMNFLVYTIANCMVEKCKNVEIITTEGIKLLADVNGFKFLMEHGDLYRGWMGFPYYSMARGRDREARKRMGTSKNFHFTTMGHFHVPAYIEDTILVNGSLSGTSELDHGLGRHSPPAQVAFLVHPKYGLFNFTPFRGKI